MTNLYSDLDKTQQVIQAERMWLGAHLQLDVSTLDRLMGDEYIQVSGRGELIGKQQVLASFQSEKRFGMRLKATSIKFGYMEM